MTTSTLPTRNALQTAAATPADGFGDRASDETIQRTADALRAKGYAVHEPEAELAPTVMRGFSDSNPFRTAFPDAVVYGFCPHREIGLLEAAPLIHGADERVPASDIELAAGFFYELPRRLLA